MMSRRLLGVSAVIVALVAGGLVVASVQGGGGRSIEVLLRQPRGAVQAPLLTIPLRYFTPGATPSDSTAAAGVEKLILEIDPADFPQALGGKAPDLAGAPLRIELTASVGLTEGLGERRRDEAMNQPEGSPKQMWVIPPDHPQEVTGYVFPHAGPRAAAYYFKSKDDGVFVDCSERPRCRGFQTWRGLLDVQYDYSRADLDDPRPMNVPVNKLLESLKPTAVPGQPGQSQAETPVFEPSTPNR